MRDGVRLGVDVGKVRVGVSRSDPSGGLAVPLETVPRAESAVERIRALAEEWDALEVVVGLPLALSGARTASTRDAEEFAEALAGRLARPVRLIDERLSTVSAQGALHASGKRARAFRPVVDQAAAVVILQHALESERSGTVPGALVSPGSEEGS